MLLMDYISPSGIAWLINEEKRHKERAKSHYVNYGSACQSRGMILRIVICILNAVITAFLH
ncbi:MAG: hypothetical protein MJK14_23355 [Rivularia sp. ALOHA_DT_140]|nr:hypothetical protein [Rivularia sp. ALOHA_DT_140]